MRKLFNKLKIFFFQILVNCLIFHNKGKEEYIKIQNNTCYNILSNDGFLNFSEIAITKKQSILKIYTNNSFLECSLNHTIFLENGKNIKSQNLQIGQWIQTKCGTEQIIKIENTNKERHLFDLIDVENSKYYTNNILSHNCGKSTSFFIYVLHYLLFNENKSAAILANKAENAKDLLHGVKLAYEQLPKWLQLGVKTWNVNRIVLENGSKCLAASTSSTGIRSKAINLLILDEFAFIQNRVFSEFYASVYPTISSSDTSKIIMVSTPNGKNHFYKFWSDAKNKKNSYFPIEINWDRVPGRDENWKKETIGNIGEVRFNQEFSNCINKNSKISIRNKKTGLIEQIKIKDLFREKYS